MQELTRLLDEHYADRTSNMHTSIPATIVEYDPNTRRATVQPSLEKALVNGTFLQIRPLVNVPIIFPSSSNYTIHFPLNQGDGVVCFFSERCLDVWKHANTSTVQDTDPRRFAMSDAYAIAGLHSIDFIPCTEDKLQITSKEGNQITIDGNTIAIVQGDSNITISGSNIAITNGASTIALEGSKTNIGNNVASLKELIEELADIFTTTPFTVGSAATQNASPAVILAVQAFALKLGQVLE